MIFRSFSWRLFNQVKYAFSGNHPKSLKKHFEQKSKEKQVSDTVIAIKRQDMIIPHRILYIQFIPLIFLQLPLVCLFNSPFDPIFLKSVISSQYYSSLLLAFNSYFSKKKQNNFIPYLITIAALNCLPGYYGIICPFILGALSLYMPNYDEILKQKLSHDQNQNLSTIIRIQIATFFIFSFIFILKTYHYVERHQIEKKLVEFDKENSSDSKMIV